MNVPGGAAVTLIARFVALPGHRDAVASLIGTYAEHVRTTPGCVWFLPTTGVEHPLEFVVLERYEDGAAFAQHIADAENAAFNAVLASHVEGPSRLEMLNDVVPRPGR
jgi:quinol monooxygenase YgiN